MSSGPNQVSIVGFSPVQPGTGIVSTGVAAAAAAEGEAAPGLFEALLAMLGKIAIPAVGEATDAGPEMRHGDEGHDPSLGPDVSLAVETAITSDLPPLPAPAEIVPLLQELTATLAAVEVQAENGTPIDTETEARLQAMMERLAQLLGTPAPQTTPLSAAPASTPPGDAPDNPVVALAQVVVGKGRIIAPLVAATGEGEKPATEKLVEAFGKAVDAARLPEAPEEKPAEGEPTEVAEQPAVRERPAAAASPETPLGRVLARLTELAEKLDEKLPEVSAKLRGIVERMASADKLDPDLLSQLDASVESGDLDALLAATPSTKPAKTPPQQVFTAPALAAPTEVIVLPKAEAKVQPRPVEPAPPAEPEPPDAEAPEAARTAPPEKSAPTATDSSDNKVRDRGSFAAHLAEVRADKVAEPSQAQSAQAAPTQARSDIGVVAPKAVHAAYQAPVQQINMPQVAFEVVRQFSQGNSRFQIRLDPPELGRIDVRMQVDGDGTVHARMTVERAETLDLMQRDQRSLERALAQAGLDSNKTNLEFSLRQNPFGRDGQGQQQGHQQNFSQRGGSNGASEAPEIAAATTMQYRGLASPSGVNLFV